jgi:hypothetical protein
MKNPMSYLQSATVSGLIAALLLTQTAAAQNPAAQAPQPQSAPQSQSAQAQQPPAPVERNPADPSLSPEALARQRLLAAHTLYLAQSTQDANFPASPDDAYNLVLNDLRNWGHYQIVDSVAQAGLVLQLRDTVHTSVVDDTTDAGSTVYYLPSFQLTLADPSTLSPLWTVSSSIPTAVKHRSQTTLLADAAQKIVSQLKLLAGDPLTASDQAAQKQVTHYYHSHIVLATVLAAAGIGLGVGLVFLFRHNAQQSQAAFCQAHNISPCPGA